MFDYDRLANLFVCLGLLGLLSCIQYGNGAASTTTAHLLLDPKRKHRCTCQPPSKKNSARLIPLFFACQLLHSADITFDARNAAWGKADVPFGARRVLNIIICAAHAPMKPVYTRL